MMNSCDCEIKNDKTRIRSEEEKKPIIHRLHRLIGQMKGIEKMVEENRYCDDILIQLAAIDKSIKSLANIILEQHMHTCLINHVQNGEYEVIDEIVDLFKRFQ